MVSPTTLTEAQSSKTTPLWTALFIAAPVLPWLHDGDIHAPPATGTTILMTVI